MQTPGLVAPEKGKITIEMGELPSLGPEQVLFETHISAISPGTELAFLHHLPNTTGTFPLHLGYSAVGQVIDKGAGVTEFEIGDKIFASIRHAAHAVVEAAQCVRLPAGLDLVEASPLRLVSIAMQGIHKAQIQLGWEVAVLGLGPIGNLAGQLARAAGATHVEGIDPVTWRHQLALDAGFDAVAASAETVSRLDGYDVVIDATGVPQAIPQAFQLTKRLGHTVLLASTRGETQDVNFYRDVHKKGITVIGAHNSIRPAVDDHLGYISEIADSHTAVKLVASGRLKTRPLISDVVSFEEADTAYERLARREEELMLIALRWK